MKRNYIYAALLYAFTVAVTPAVAGQPQQEKIGRGVVAVKTDEGVFVSWRYLGTDSPSAGFNLYRDGEKLNDEPIMTSTNYVDKEGTAGSVYVVKRVDYGKETDISEETGVWDKFYRKIKLQRPPSGVTPPYSVTNGDKKEDYPNGQFYSYTPNDCSVGDVDGDGKYEIMSSGIRPIHATILTTESREKSISTVTNSTARSCGVSISGKTYGRGLIIPNSWFTTSTGTVRPKWPVKRLRARSTGKARPY